MSDKNNPTITPLAGITDGLSDVNFADLIIKSNVNPSYSVPITFTEPNNHTRMVAIIGERENTFFIELNYDAVRDKNIVSMEDIEVNIDDEDGKYIVKRKKYVWKPEVMEEEEEFQDCVDKDEKNVKNWAKNLSNSQLIAAKKVYFERWCFKDSSKDNKNILCWVEEELDKRGLKYAF